jgi:hypothetical protein
MGSESCIYWYNVVLQKDPAMGNKLFGIVALLSVLGIASVAEAAGKIAGYQYYTFSNGDVPIEGNVIHYIPCSAANDCKALANEISTEAKKALADLDRAKLTFEKPLEAWDVFTQLDQRFLPMVTSKEGYATVKTGKKGVYSFRCPTATCLVYSTSFTRERYSYWVVVEKQRKRLDLGPSKGIAADKPLKI